MTLKTRKLINPFSSISNLIDKHLLTRLFFYHYWTRRILFFNIKGDLENNCLSWHLLFSLPLYPQLADLWTFQEILLQREEGLTNQLTAGRISYLLLYLWASFPLRFHLMRWQIALDSGGAGSGLCLLPALWLSVRLPAPPASDSVPL